MNTNAVFIPGQYYHVYNRTNNRESLFKEVQNRSFFLEKFNQYIRPFCIVHAYVLMDNHFHYSIKVRELKVIVNYINNLNKHSVSKQMIGVAESIHKEEHIVFCAINQLLLRQFQNFFISYAKSINKIYDRTGSLFQKKFKRSLYDPIDKFKYLQYYIHHNARKHRVVKNFLEYDYHSYFEIVENQSKFIDVDEVLDKFESLTSFIEFHNSVQYREKFSGIDLDGFL